MTDFKIRRGLSTDLFINGDNKAGVIEGVVLENGCWYLCTDTADLFICVQQSNGLALKRINEKAGWDISVDGDTIDASVIIALRAEVNNIKEGLKGYAKTSDIPSLEEYATKEFVVDAIDKHEALATVEEVKTKLEKEVLPVIPTVQETILPTVQKVETEILPTVQELVEKTATQEWVEEKNFATESFVTYAVSGKADKDHAHDNYADKNHFHEQYLTEHQSLDHKADKEHSHEEYLTEHQDLSHLAAKEHTHEEYALASHKHDEYLTEHQDISGKADINYVRDNYADKGHLHEQYLTEHQNLDHKADVGHTHEEYLTELPIHTHDEYLTELPEHTHSEYLTELPKHSHDEYLTELPEHTHSEYLTELPEHTHSQYLTAHQDISGKADVGHKHDDLYDAKGAAEAAAKAVKNELLNGAGEAFDTLKELGDLINTNGNAIKSLENIAASKADSAHSHDNYAAKEHTHEVYYTKSEVDDTLTGYAKTETIPTDYLTESDLKGYAKSDDLSDMATKTWVSDQGFITNVDNKADVNHTHDDYLTSSALDGYSKFSGSYKDLTDKPEIPSLEGYALKSEVDLKANNVLFTDDKYVTTAFGGFVNGESVKYLTIAQLLTKLLGLSDEAPSVDPDNPSESDGVVENIISNKLPMYSIGTAGGIDAAAFDEVITYTEASINTKPNKSGFYQVVDESGVVTESGYQDLTVDNPNMLYIIALPKEIDFNTMVTVQVYDDLDSCWKSTHVEMSNDAEQLSGICAAFGIDLSNIDLEKYTLWADLTSGQGPSGKIYRFIINE